MSVTALLLNWKRPKNMKKVIKCLKAQSLRPEIILWNNNPDDSRKHDVSLQVNSGRNMHCYPRWLMAGLADTEFVFSLDDDLMLVDKNALKKCVEYMKDRIAKDKILGYKGVILNKRKSYENSKHVSCPDANVGLKVDIVKGRFMFMRRNFACSIPAPRVMLREDDIYVSSWSKNKELPGFLGRSFKDLPEGKVSLYKQKGHIKLRQDAVNEWYR